MPPNKPVRRSAARLPAKKQMGRGGTKALPGRARVPGKKALPPKTGGIPGTKDRGVRLKKPGRTRSA